MRVASISFVMLFGVACGDDDGMPDAGMLDAGAFDADTERPDGGDAGPFDAGVDGGAAVDGGPAPDDGVPDVVCGSVATDEAALRAAIASASAGDTICLEARDWPDLELEVDATGTAGAPVTIAAERAGETFLTGASGIAMAGEHVVVTGLVFRRGRSARSHLIDFRVGDAECFDCRLSNVAVIELADEGDTKWVGLRGQRNRVDHCAFIGKANDGALLVVWRPDDGTDEHRIDHNTFAERPDLGRNGGETIRVGTSDQHRSSSRTVVEENYFYRSDGEIEIISNKSGDNVYRRNVFEECAGLLTLRHGQNALVEGNVFLVGGVSGGGIRIVDAGHRVINNYVEGCRGTSNVRGGLVLMLADESPELNGYQQVEDVLVAHNTVVDCEQSVVFGGGRASVAPRTVTFANNLFANGDFDVVREEVALDGSTVEGNVYAGGTLGTDGTGFAVDDAALTRDGVMLRPTVGLEGAPGHGVERDIDGAPRDSPPDVGADELGPVRRPPITRAETGPTYDPESLRD